MVETKIMLSLDDPKLVGIAEILKNKTAKRILGYLTENTSSVSKTADELKLPLNTVDYNIKKLKGVGLIMEEKHFWSARGKRMPAYTTSNKEIIISPRTSFIKKTILPAFLVSAFATMVIYLRGASHTVKLMVEDATLSGGAESMPALSRGIDLTVPMFSSGEPIWVWFLFGAVTALILVYLFNKLNLTGGKK